MLQQLFSIRFFAISKKPASAELLMNLNNEQNEEVKGLSIIVPVFNEERYVHGVIHDLLNMSPNFPYEIIVVDDGSTDNSKNIIKSIQLDSRFYIIEGLNNKGKGNAVRKGIEQANFSHILIFDSDNEYSASDIPAMFELISKKDADIVFGVRVPENTYSHSYLHSLGRRVMTMYANLLFRSKIRDLHTGLKLIPTRVLRTLELSEDGFGLDTEITCLLLKNNLTIAEVPIKYVGRTIADGKKIRFKDALICLKIITHNRIISERKVPQLQKNVFQH